MCRSKKKNKTVAGTEKEHIKNEEPSAMEEEMFGHVGLIEGVERKLLKKAKQREN